MQSTLTKALVLSILFGCHGTGVGAAAVRSTGSSPVMSAQQFGRSAGAIVHVETPRRAGVGFVVDEAGWIATTHGLLEGERQARVLLADGRLLAVDRVLASDAPRDIAIVSVQSDGLPVLDLAERADVRVGDRVAILGHALGMFAPSATEAVVDAVPNPDRDGRLRLSAPTPAGHAGAPVLDGRGRVIAIVGSDMADEASLATPAKHVSRLIGGLRAGAGESMKEFGDRTSDDEGMALRSELGPDVLEGCSASSRERIWHEIQFSLRVAAPVYEIGADEAAFRVLESSTLRLTAEITDCEALLHALETARIAGGRGSSATEAVQLLARAYEQAIDALFASDSAASAWTRR